MNRVGAIDIKTGLLLTQCWFGQDIAKHPYWLFGSPPWKEPLGQTILVTAFPSPTRKKVELSVPPERATGPEGNIILVRERREIQARDILARGILTMFGFDKAAKDGLWDGFSPPPKERKKKPTEA